MSIIRLETDLQTRSLWSLALSAQPKALGAPPHPHYWRSWKRKNLCSTTSIGFLGIPTYDLDDLFWDSAAQSYGVRASDTDRDIVLSITSKRTPAPNTAIIASFKSAAFALRAAPRQSTYRLNP